jgi:hypothetical protein
MKKRGWFLSNDVRPVKLWNKKALSKFGMTATNDMHFTHFEQSLALLICVECEINADRGLNTSPFRLEIHINQDLNNKAKLNKYKSKKQTQALLGKFCFCYLPKRAKWFRVEVKDWTVSFSESTTPFRYSRKL